VKPTSWLSATAFGLLVDRIISTAWRLRRSGALEARLLSDKHGDGAVLENVLPWETDRKKLQLLSRYEATLERSFYKALHELQPAGSARRTSCAGAIGGRCHRVGRRGNGFGRRNGIR
jgi:hypothetical protein